MFGARLINEQFAEECPLRQLSGLDAVVNRVVEQQLLIPL